MFSDSGGRAKSVAIALAALVTILVIIWVDIATGFWNEMVILSGLAAGLVTFLLTVLVLDKIVARETERRWAPVNRLALSEFLHAIADEEHSEISRGHVVARRFSFEAPDEDAALTAALHRLREQVVEERTRVADPISRWAQFLTASGDNEQVLRHVADFAFQLDGVRDTALEVEEALGDAALRERLLGELVAQIEGSNATMLSLVNELRDRVLAEERA